jgi:hypothetical protein
MEYTAGGEDSCLQLTEQIEAALAGGWVITRDLNRELSSAFEVVQWPLEDLLNLLRESKEEIVFPVAPTVVGESAAEQQVESNTAALPPPDRPVRLDDRAQPVEFALLFKRLGLCPIPYDRGSKAPRSRGWPNWRLNESEIAQKFARPCNVGLILGPASDCLVDIDLDCPEANLVADAVLPRTELVFGRASKPRSHFLYRCPDLQEHGILRQFKDPDGTTLLEFRASSKAQTMAPPSLHPSGELVRFDSWGPRLELPYADLLKRAGYLAAVSLLARRWTKGSRHDLSLCVAGALLRTTMPKDEVRAFIACVCRAAGDEEAQSRLANVETTALRIGESAPATGWPSLTDAVGEEGSTKLRDWLCLSQEARAEDDPHRQIRRAHGEVAAEADEFQVTDKGVPYKNQHNVRVALRKMGVQLSHDQFANRLFITGLCGFGSALVDEAVARIWLETERQFGFRPNKDFYWTVVQDEARRRGFHPVHEYLDELRWDETPRIDTWLCRYGNASDTPYVRAVGGLMLVAAVRRVRKPGCKFDEMVVLESPQGDLKSTALQTLAVRDEWFTDDLPLNADTPRVIEQLGGRWIVEAAELKGLRKGDIEHLKTFLSRRVDRARLAYGRMPVEQPRQCVIVGTTNDERYLRDNTGNRRFWPVRVGRFDVESLRADRDQLWAEAAHREATGASIRLDPALYGTAAEQQADRQVADPWVATMEAALGDRHGKLRAEEAWLIVGLRSAQRTQEHNVRLGSAMQELGWERKKLRFGSTPAWCYVKGSKAEREQQLTVSVIDEQVHVRPDVL